MAFIIQGHLPCWLVTEIFICLLSLSSADDSNRYLYVPALGRSAQIGDLYNARKSEFCDTSAFKSSHYQVPTIEVKNPRSTIETTTLNTFHDIYQLLGIEIATAASILSGLLKITKICGTAEILKNTLENPTGLEVEGTLIYTHQTVEQSLPLLYDKLKDLYNTDVLLTAHNDATHVVSGITWGGSLSIIFQDNAVPAREQEQVRASLNAEFLKLQSTGRKFDNETFNFTTFVKSDITLANIELCCTSDVRTLFNEFVNSLQNINDGKGVQILFKLTPLGVVQEHLKIRNSTITTTTVHSITISVLKHFVTIFEELSNSEQRLNKLYTDVNSKQNCILPQNLDKILELRSSLSEYKDTLTSKFKELLFDVRNGTQPMSALYDLIEEYKAGNFSSVVIKSKLAEFSDALEKFEFCKTIEKSEKKLVKYFGSRGDLISTIYQNFDKNIYLFFTKTEFTKNNLIKYTEDLGFFLKTHQGTNNKLLIVDCDFSHDICSNVSEPTIYEYKNNEVVTSRNFKNAVQEDGLNWQEQINQLKNNLANLMNITGKTCQYQPDPCAQNTCQNGAICTPSEDFLSSTCNCKNGYTGAFCGCNLRSYGQTKSSGSLKVVTVAECGGLVKIPNLPAKSSFLLDYKSNVIDTNGEECLWTLDSTHGGTSDRLKVRVTLLCDGFIDSGETLSILGWTFSGQDWVLSQNVLSKRVPKYNSAGWDNKLFLHYMTSTNARQSGFILQIDILEVQGGISGSNFVFKTVPGKRNFGPFKLYDTFSMTVIPSQTNFTLTVNYFDFTKASTCQGVDVLHIYRIKSVRRSDTLAKLCRRLTSPVSFASVHPIVVLYCTNKSTQGQGFSLSWK